MNLRCSLPLLNDQPDDEGPDDDFAATTSKRLRRGSQFFAKPDSIPTLAFAVLSMTPYQRLMGFLFTQSKAPSTDVLELRSHLNRLESSVITMMRANYRTDDTWRLMQMFSTCDVFSDEWLRYYRREILRALGGFRCRFVDEHKRGIMHVIYELLACPGDPSCSQEVFNSIKALSGDGRACCEGKFTKLEHLCGGDHFVAVQRNRIGHRHRHVLRKAKRVRALKKVPSGRN